MWGTPSLEAGLFGGFEDAPGPPFGASVHTPRAFIEEARLAACHRDPDRFDLLYRVLLRLQREDGLWSRTVDPDIHRLLALAKSVRRDRHKMTAFVRFREIATEAGAAYVAWFEPVHRIVELTSPFFLTTLLALDSDLLGVMRKEHAQTDVASGALSIISVTPAIALPPITLITRRGHRSEALAEFGAALRKISPGRPAQ